LNSEVIEKETSHRTEGLLDIRDRPPLSRNRPIAPAPPAMPTTGRRMGRRVDSGRVSQTQPIPMQPVSRILTGTPP
jgi:hypothetical protein